MPNAGLLLTLVAIFGCDPRAHGQGVRCVWVGLNYALGHLGGRQHLHGAQQIQLGSHTVLAGHGHTEQTGIT